MPISELTIVIGQNDVGKSTILFALDLFFKEHQLAQSDIHLSSRTNEVEITLRFGDVPDGLVQRLLEAANLSSQGEFVVKKTFAVGSKKVRTQILCYDFEQDQFRQLQTRKEKDLDSVAKELGVAVAVDASKEEKAKAVWKHLVSIDSKRLDLWFDPDTDVAKEALAYLPQFVFFPSQLNTSVDQAMFQNPLVEIIESQIKASSEVLKDLEARVLTAIDQSMESVQQNLKQQTDAIARLIPKPTFQFRKLVSIDIDTEDSSGMVVPLENRGLGVQRLVMVAFLRHLAEKPAAAQTNLVLGIEEPETSLHPRAQRQLLRALADLRAKGEQVVITSHSPVFVSRGSLEDILLITRSGGRASVTFGTKLDIGTIADELGVLPRDRLFGYVACVYVEGASDEFYFQEVAKTLKSAGKLPVDFAERKIGLVQVGGANLQFYVEQRHLSNLSRTFAVVVDSGRRDANQSVPQRMLRWKEMCEKSNGTFHILRRREIENYLHPAAIKRVLGKDVTVAEYNDVKAELSASYDWNKHLKPVIIAMTADEILEQGEYFDGGKPRNEILELFSELVGLGG